MLLPQPVVLLPIVAASSSYAISTDPDGPWSLSVHLRSVSMPLAEHAQAPLAEIQGTGGLPAVAVSGAALQGGSLSGVTLSVTGEAPAARQEPGEGRGAGDAEEERAACVVRCGGGGGSMHGDSMEGRFEMRGCTVRGAGERMTGVHVSGAFVSVAITETTVRGGGWGVRCSGGGSLECVSCVITECAGGGCNVEAGSHAGLARCDVVANGVGVETVGSFTMADCTIRGSTSHGIVVRGDGASIEERAAGSGGDWGARSGARGGIFVTEQGQGSFEGCDVYENKVHGVCVQGTGSPTVRGTRVHGNVLAGIFVTEQGQGSFEDCEVCGSRRHGVCVSGTGSPTVGGTRVHDACRHMGSRARARRFEGCDVYENKWQGVCVQGTGSPTVRGTRVHGNEWRGILVAEQGQGSFEGCDVYENELHGVCVQGTGSPTVRGTRVHGNGGDGVSIHESTTGTVEDCSIESERGHGVLLQGASALTVSRGRICGHARFETGGDIGSAAAALRTVVFRAGEAKALWQALVSAGEAGLQCSQTHASISLEALPAVDAQLRELDRAVQGIEQHVARADISDAEEATLRALRERRRDLAAACGAGLGAVCDELRRRVRCAREAVSKSAAPLQTRRGGEPGGAGDGGTEQRRPRSEVESAGEAAEQARARCIQALLARPSPLQALCGPLASAAAPPPSSSTGDDASTPSRVALEEEALQAGRRELELWQTAAKTECAHLQRQVQARREEASRLQALLEHYTERCGALQSLAGREEECAELCGELQALEDKQTEVEDQQRALQRQDHPAAKRRRVVLKLSGGSPRPIERGVDADELAEQRRVLKQRERGVRMLLRQKVALLPEFVEEAGLLGDGAAALWRSRTVSADYTEVKVLEACAHREVLEALFAGEEPPHHCVLKRFATGDGGARQVAEKEVRILARLRHPLVVPIEAVFYDAERGQSYLQLPFAERGTLQRWGEETPPGERVRETHAMGRALFQGLAYVHGEQVIHRDVKPSNILIRSDGRPQLADFDISKDTRNTDCTTRTTMAGTRGTPGYMAPEVEAGGESTPASDCWSAGAVLYWLHFGEEAVLRGRGTVAVPATAEDALRELLEALLQRKPSQRPTAAEVLVSPYMMRGAPHGEERDASLASRQQVLAFHEHVAQVHSSTARSSTSMRLTRHPRSVEEPASRVLDPLEVLGRLQEISQRNLRRKLQVEFHGEAGQDAGGLTTEMYKQLWDEVVRPEVGLFERGENGRVLPVTDSDMTPHKAVRLRTVGLAMAKCIFDRRLVRADFAPSLYNDLDHFDPGYGRQMTFLLVTPGHAAYLEEEALACGESLSEENKAQYVQEQVQRKLVQCRRRGLEAVRDGFLAAAEALNLRAHVDNLRWVDLKSLSEGEDHISAADIKQVLWYGEFPPNCNMEARFGEVLDCMEESELRQLLYAITGFHHIPSGGLRNPNELVANRNVIEILYHPLSALPMFHTCFFRMDLPGYPNLSIAELRGKINEAVTNSVDVGFQIA
ncbi:hypothetical protein CYMTET_4889 [Cymbomonas tetramitiformis]|uniref:Uncharacterized protein n=1 Tax=Cymbomonas tetramitiformis TaxID=36881 RepID=A0AAE0H0G2_9CHLO|nr:hypothetical protein CYMTET_4889 [Cymbomonas tetramitiformis]